jgi:hypothetical protein
MKRLAARLQSLIKYLKFCHKPFIFPGVIYHEFYRVWVFNTYLINAQVKGILEHYQGVVTPDEKKIMPV